MGKIIFTAYGKEFIYESYSISKFVLDKENIPINPFLNFGYNLGEYKYGSLVREANNELVRRCDELWVFSKISEEFENLADGVQREVSIAQDEKKEVRYFKRGLFRWEEYFPKGGNQNERKDNM